MGIDLQPKFAARPLCFKIEMTEATDLMDESTGIPVDEINGTFVITWFAITHLYE